MNLIDVISLCEVIFAGLLAGFEVGVHYGIGAPPSSLPEHAQILFRQALVRRLRILAPAIFLPALVLEILLTVQARHDSGAWLRDVTLGMFSLWIGIRVLRTVPVNSATLEWSPEAPPSNWRAQVQRTERFHVFAAWGTVIAFLCSLGSLYSLR